jgi:hypothetical protein
MKTKIKQILEEKSQALTYEYPIGIADEDFEEVVNKLETLFSLHLVSQQRELLGAFAEWLQYNGKWDLPETQVKNFLEEQNK